MHDEGVSRRDATGDGGLIGDGTGEQDSPVGLIIQTSSRDLLAVGVRFWGLDLSHLFASLGHDAGYDGLHRDGPDGRSKIKGLEMNLSVVSRLARWQTKDDVFVCRGSVGIHGCREVGVYRNKRSA
jgi:hypothetical protein